MKFSQEDIKFLDSLNNTGDVKNNIYTTAQHGYARNMDRSIIKQLETIYKSAINPKFSVCYYCQREILTMILELYREMEKQKAQAVTVGVEPELEYTPPVKISRKAKHE